MGPYSWIFDFHLWSEEIKREYQGCPDKGDQKLSMTGRVQDFDFSYVSDYMMLVVDSLS